MQKIRSVTHFMGDALLNSKTLCSILLRNISLFLHNWIAGMKIRVATEFWRWILLTFPWQFFNNWRYVRCLKRHDLNSFSHKILFSKCQTHYRKQTQMTQQFIPGTSVIFHDIFRFSLASRYSLTEATMENKQAIYENWGRHIWRVNWLIFIWWIKLVSLN